MDPTGLDWISGSFRGLIVGFSRPALHLSFAFNRLSDILGEPARFSFPKDHILQA
jgi:hypothetical protein